MTILPNLLGHTKQEQAGMEVGPHNETKEFLSDPPLP